MGRNFFKISYHNRKYRELYEFQKGGEKYFCELILHFCIWFNKGKKCFKRGNISGIDFEKDNDAYTY